MQHFTEIFRQDDGDRKFEQQHTSLKFASGEIIVIETTILIFLQNKNWPEFSRFKPAEKEENHLENFLRVIFLYYV